MTIEDYIGDGNGDEGGGGSSFGHSSTDKITFYGGTPRVRSTTVYTSTGVTSISSVSGVVGLSSVAQMTSLLSTVNELAALVDYLNLRG